MNDISQIVIKKILQFRKAKGLTQEELALRTGLHRAYIGQIERGEKIIGLINLKKIADALEVDIRDFFGD